MSDLKELVYPGFGPNANGKVIYIVVSETQVYFSGITSPNESTSTINAAESVVRAICQREGIDWRDGRFYDIRTYLGYHSILPDEFEVYLLSIESDKEQNEDGFVVVDWQLVELSKVSENILSPFRQYISN